MTTDQAGTHVPLWMACSFVALVVCAVVVTVVLVVRARVRAADLRRVDAAMPHSPGLEQPDGQPDYAVEAQQHQRDRDRLWPFRMRRR